MKCSFVYFGLVKRGPEGIPIKVPSGAEMDRFQWWQKWAAEPHMWAAREA